MKTDGGEDMIIRIMVLLAVMLISTAVHGREIAGIDVPETITQSDGTQLQLNGAGIRSKLFFKIYVAQLYLAKKQSEVGALLQEDDGRRIVMDFLYDTVEKEKLTEGWDQGFQGNGSAAQLTELAAQITTFNSLFDTVKKGDQIVLDYEPGKGTTVLIRGENKGTVEGKPFNDLLLLIWLGEKPVSKTLRNEMLGG